MEGRVVDVAGGLEALRRAVASVLTPPALSPALAPAFAGVVPAGRAPRSERPLLDRLLLAEAATTGEADPGAPGPGGFDDADLAASSEVSEVERTQIGRAHV